MADSDESADEKEGKPVAAKDEAGDEATDDEDFEVFDLDDIEVIESKVFG